MEKGKRVAPIRPMLPLAALIMLLVARLSAAAAASGDMVMDGGVIRLPSDATTSSGKPARADEAATAAAAPSAMPGGDYDEKRPWECCDVQVCTMSVLPSCWCHDILERCSKACKECRKLRGSDPPRYVCKDVYRGEPAPRCTPLP